MSHEIMASDNMAYRGETPWHRLGTSLEDGASAHEFMKAAGLDFIVEKRPIYFEAADEPDAFQEIEGQYALVRNTDERVYGVCSRYTPFQNEEVFSFMHDLCEQNGLQMETAGSLKNGEVVWSLARAPEAAEIKGGDKLGRYVLLLNSHKPGQAFQYAETMVRVVCWNTAQLALRQAESARTAWRLGHQKSFAAQKVEILDDLQLTTDAWEEGVQLASEAQRIPMSDSDARDYMGDVCGWEIVEAAIEQTAKRQEADRAAGKTEEEQEYEATVSRTGSVLEGIVAADERKFQKHVEKRELSRKAARALSYLTDSPGSDMEGSKGTLWGCLNAVTYMSDHDTTGGNLERRVASATMGSRAEVKRRAVEQARHIISTAGAAR